MSQTTRHFNPLYRFEFFDCGQFVPSKLVNWNINGHDKYLYNLFKKEIRKQLFYLQVFSTQNACQIPLLAAIIFNIYFVVVIRIAFYSKIPLYRSSPMVLSSGRTITTRITAISPFFNSSDVAVTKQPSLQTINRKQFMQPVESKSFLSFSCRFFSCFIHVFLLDISWKETKLVITFLFLHLP